MQAWHAALRTCTPPGHNSTEVPWVSSLEISGRLTGLRGGGTGGVSFRFRISHFAHLPLDAPIRKKIKAYSVILFLPWFYTTASAHYHIDLSALP